MKSPRWIQSRWLPPLSILALALVVFWRLVGHPGGLIVDPIRASVDHANRADPRPVGNDLTFLLLPHHLSIKQALSRYGHLPLWDTRGFGGRPMVGNPQGGLFYPPVWSVWLTGAEALPGWITVAHLVWGGLGAYMLARANRLERFAATVAGGVYLASPLLLAHTFEGHYPHVWSACWYPWAFWAYTSHRSGRIRGTLLLPVFLALTYLTGHPQEWYLLMLALGSWAVADIARLARAHGVHSALRFAAAWSGIVLLSLGLGGVELAPQVAVRPWLLGADAGAPPSPIPDGYRLRSLNLLQLVSPFALGGPSNYFVADNYWETVCSIGLVPLLLLSIGVWLHPNRRGVRGWLCLLALAVWFACGRQLGLFAILYKTLPGMTAFRVPGRSLFLANLAAAILAGMGTQVLRSAAAWPARRRARIFGDHGIQRFAGAFFGVVSLIELAWYGASMIQVAPSAQFLAPGPIDQAVASLTQVTDPKSPGECTPPVRVKARDNIFGDLAAMRLELEKANINDVFQIGHAAKLYETLYPVASRARPYLRTIPANGPVEEFDRNVRQAIMDRMAVTFLISDRVERDPDWPVVAAERSSDVPFVIQRNPTALPRAYVVPNASVEPDDAKVALALLRAINPRQSVLMSRDPLAGIPPTAREAFQPARWSSLDPDHPALEVRTKAPGLLVVADTWMPGWTARVDGVPAPIYRGNFAQRVIPLPTPGRHEIQMDYWPPGFTIGLAMTVVSCLAWLILAASAIITRHWRHRRSRTQSLVRNVRAVVLPRLRIRHRFPALHPSGGNGRRAQSIPQA